jgi:hypothetical protein
MSEVLRLKRLRLLLLVVWLAVPFRLAWMQWVERFYLIKHPLNARVAERLAWRGAIVDRHLRPVALSKSSKRFYPCGSLTAHWGGYYSTKFGLAGAERWKNELLRERRGSDGKTSLAGHRLRLSLDLEIQRQLPGWLGKSAGAALVVDLDSGQLLGSFSSPTFEPARVEVEWPLWQKDPAAATLNRPLLGLYPAGHFRTRWGEAMAVLPAHSQHLMDWTGPREIDGQWLMAPIHLAHTVLRAGSPLSLSQLYSEHRRLWEPPKSWWKSLPWKEGRYREMVQWRAQRVEWLLQLRGHQLWLAIREDPVSP